MTIDLAELTRLVVACKCRTEVSFDASRKPNFGETWRTAATACIRCRRSLTYYGMALEKARQAKLAFRFLTQSQPV